MQLPSSWLCFALSMLVVGCAQRPTTPVEDRPVAQVGERKISVAEVEECVARDKTPRDTALEKLILIELFAKDAVRQGSHRRAWSVLAKLADRLIAKENRRLEPISEAEERRFYEAEKARSQRGEYSAIYSPARATFVALRFPNRTSAARILPKLSRGDSVWLEKTAEKARKSGTGGWFSTVDRSFAGVPAAVIERVFDPKGFEQKVEGPIRAGAHYYAVRRLNLERETRFNASVQKVIGETLSEDRRRELANSLGEDPAARPRAGSDLRRKQTGAGAERTLATVDGEAISVADLESFSKAVDIHARQPRRADQGREGYRRAILQDAVSLMTLAREAERQGFLDDWEVKAALASIARNDFAAGFKPQIEDHELRRQFELEKQAYASDSKKSRIYRPESVKVWHIESKDRTLALQFLAEVKPGAKLGDAVKRTGLKGRSLTLVRGRADQRLPPLLQAKAFELEPAQWSEPIMINGVIHLIGLKERTPETTFDEARRTLFRALAATQRQQRLDEHVARMKKEAGVKIDSEVLASIRDRAPSDPRLAGLGVGVPTEGNGKP